MPSTASLPVVTSPQLALHHTRFSNWFPLYRRHSPKATVIDLLTVQPDFVNWLEEDGLILPRDSDIEEQPNDFDDEDDSERDDSNDDDDDDEEAAAEPRNFDPLNARIRQVLSAYEGAVFPKLDWSAPSVSLSSIRPFDWKRY
jgi:hypothetical protein